MLYFEIIGFKEGVWVLLMNMSGVPGVVKVCAAAFCNLTA